ncbi:MAG: hypothetical protein H6818_20525 [Phycisphaerales bacterium]|nr:hypothetical protein [Phycisphaerales bacterium]
MTHIRRRAFLQLEAITTMCIMIFVIGALTAAILSLARAGHAQISRQQATLAAEAVMNEVREGNAPTDDEFRERFPDMDIHIERTPAAGDFDGLDCAIVHVDAYTFGRKTASVRLRGFVEKEAAE